MMAESAVIITRPNSSSPPPNCAICLGTFSNKCFSDSCMHQFCFTCLLEWSKIKAECPLCKQPFKRIIHNVKSNDEYDEHVVEINRPDEIHIIDNEEFLLFGGGASLPQPSTRHHFHFRTTFTVDTRGEHAIQQMLRSFPLSNGGHIAVGGIIPSTRRRRDNTSTTFRRSIYSRNLWVSAPPDVTGRYRDVSPAYFRSCPGARTRLVPWLNRELNALLYEDTRLVMHLVDVILDHLPRHHICSRTFRNLLVEYLDNKTDHFIHEFYNFMRSPYDMVGYDRHVVYTEMPRNPPPYVLLPDDDPSSDSDVIVVGASSPQHPVVIDLLNTDSDSDSDEPILVAGGEGPMPAPVLEPPPPHIVVDNVVLHTSPEPTPPTLPVGTDTRVVVDEESTQSQTRRNEGRSPLLPIKLRLKRKRLSREKEQMEERRRRRTKAQRGRSSTSERSRSSSTSSTSSSTTSSSYSSDEFHVRYRRKRKPRKMSKKRRHVISSSETELNVTNTSSSDSAEDLSLNTRLKRRPVKKTRRSNARSRSYRSHTSFRSNSKPGSSMNQAEEPSGVGTTEKSYTPPLQDTKEVYYAGSSANADANDRPSCSKYERPSQDLLDACRLNVPTKSDDTTDDDYPLNQMLNGRGDRNQEVRTVIKDEQHQNGGSEGVGKLTIKKEGQSNMWFAYPCFKSDVSDS